MLYWTPSIICLIFYIYFCVLYSTCFVCPPAPHIPLCRRMLVSWGRTQDLCDFGIALPVRRSKHSDISHPIYFTFSFLSVHLVSKTMWRLFEKVLLCTWETSPYRRLPQAACSWAPRWRSSWRSPPQPPQSGSVFPEICNNSVANSFEIFRLATLQGKSHICIPFLGIPRPQSQFPHSCVCERFIYPQDWSTYFLAAE